MPQTPALLTLNAGSSSLKLAVFEIGSVVRRPIFGSDKRIGLDAARFQIADERGYTVFTKSVPIKTYQQALKQVLTRLAGVTAKFRLTAIGHRVAHGGPNCDRPADVTPALKARLGGLVDLALLHLPASLAGTAAVTAMRPNLPQITNKDARQKLAC